MEKRARTGVSVAKAGAATGRSGRVTAAVAPAAVASAAPAPALPPAGEPVRAVSRALQVLTAFRPHEPGLSLTELARRLVMGKSTVLRTARTLAQAGFLSRHDDGRWRLGPAAGWLGVCYQTAFDASNRIDAVLRRLAGDSGETAAFFVPEGDGRTCVARVDRPSLERHHIRVGEKLPLDRGASGRVLTAFGAARTADDAGIRRAGYYVSVAERDSTMSSIAVPVFGRGRRLFGAVCVSGTTERLDRARLLAHLPALIRASERLSAALSVAQGEAVTPEPARRRSGRDGERVGHDGLQVGGDGNRR